MQNWTTAVVITLLGVAGVIFFIAFLIYLAIVDVQTGKKMDGVATVIEKHYNSGYTTVVMAGKTPIVTYHPPSWSLTLRGINEEDNSYMTHTYNVSLTIWEKVEENQKVRIHDSKIMVLKNEEITYY